MTIYRDVLSAVVRALAAEVMSVGGQCLQGAPITRRTGNGVGRDDMRDYDCMTHRLLHHTLSPEHWSALVGKYSTHHERKAQSLTWLAEWVPSPAPARFRSCCAVVWGFPRPKGAAGKRSTFVIPEGWYCMDNWDDTAAPIKTQERWRRELCRALDKLVCDALMLAQEALEKEDLIIGQCA
jgi:hypothetical protein